MPKRSKRSEKGASKESSRTSKASSKASSKGLKGSDGSDPDGPDEGSGLAEPLPTGAAVEERGAFAIARCDRCGWQGTARRSRDRARKDLRQHLEDKPKHADHVSLSNVAG